MSMLILCCGTKLPDNSQPTDGQMLGERGDSAEEEVEGVLKEDGKGWDWRIGYRGRRKRFDVGPGKVDIEKEEKCAEASNRGLVYSD